MKYSTHSAEETIKLGAKFASLLKRRKVFALHGELGSGKTTFTQGLAKGLGITKPMTSPTYIIMRTYEIKSQESGDRSQVFYHVDLYRTETEHDIEGIGLLELLKEDESLFAIEWPEKMKTLLPESTVHFYFSYSDDEKHIIEVNEEENHVDESWYETPATDFPIRIAGGGVVIRKDGEKLLVALCHEGAFGSLVLPKGGVDEGESIEEGAKREVAEEAGITDLISLGLLGITKRYTMHKNAWTEIHFFLFVTEQIETNPTETDHAYMTEWFDLDHLPEMYWKEQKQLIEENREKIKTLVNQYISHSGVKR